MAKVYFKFDLTKLSRTFIGTCRNALPSLDVYDAAYQKKEKP